VNIVVDARESLLALLHPSGEGAFHAIYTANPYVAAVQHSGLQFEFITTHVRDGIFKKADSETLRNIVLIYIRFSLHKIPGYREMLTGGTPMDVTPIGDE
jgi:hypothetical protein